MVINEFQFLLEIHAADGRVLGQRRIEPNLSPAVEWARFAAWRRASGSTSAFAADAIVEPVAQGSAGLPCASRFRVTLSSDGEILTHSEFPLTYFAAEARAISTEMVTTGLLKGGETFLYRLLAYPRGRTPAKKAARPCFKVVEVVEVPALQPVLFADLLPGSMPFGEISADDVPVFIPQEILEEASDLTEKAGAVETGGILVGHLCADESIPDIGVRVTAQIPARHARGELGKLTFTAETWAAVRSALALRRSGEVMCGWWHSHPAFAWCAETCPQERRRTCPLTRNFFSGDDVCLHQTVFPAAFHTALVVTNTNRTRDGLQHALFGWSHGIVRQRGFHLLNPDRPWRPAEAIVQGDPVHATPCQ